MVISELTLKEGKWVKWTSGHVNKVDKWTKLDKGGYVDKVVMWIKWICGQSG
jgi:hypothetical protein